MVIDERLVASTALWAVSLGAAQAQVAVKLGVLNDRSGVYSDIGGEGSVLAAKMAVEDFKACREGRARRGRLRRPPEQAGRRLDIARQWYDQDGVDVILDVPTSSVALAINQITREKNKIFLNSGAATLRPHRRAMLAQHDPLGLRHGAARERDGRRHGEAGRQHLVLPHGRLRLRPRAGARHQRGREEERRPGRRRRQDAVPVQRLLVLPAPGAGLEGQGHRPRQRGRRHDQLDQAGLRVRHHAGRAEPGRRCSCS